LRRQAYQVRATGSARANGLWSLEVQARVVGVGATGAEMNGDLFTALDPRWVLAEGVVLLKGYARDAAPDLLTAIDAVCRLAPPRRMQTPGGRAMSVAMSNCGALGWVSDGRGYRYTPCDPVSGRPWPAMPGSLARLAQEGAARAGFADFSPDACLINRYEPGARMSLHQDRDEKDFTQPIVSASLGLPATFVLGGAARRDPVMRIGLEHGDVLVFGGPARLRFHGVLPVRAAAPSASSRLNLTFRKAG
jgi:alkylated DNA repair protein (DNA oxidative demethylase)